MKENIPFVSKKYQRGVTGTAKCQQKQTEGPFKNNTEQMKAGESEGKSADHIHPSLTSVVRLLWDHKKM